MISFYEYVKNRGINIPETNIPSEWFSKHGYPMVVRCSCCEMTMAIPSAWIDEEGYTFCSDCAGVKMAEHEKYIRELAFDYWNFDKEPPHTDIKEVMEYIRAHPSLFKGLTPQ